MTVSARTLALLMEAGLEGEQLLAVVRSVEDDVTALARPLDVAAERRRASDRERKRNVRGNSADMSADNSADNPPGMVPSSASPDPSTSTPLNPPNKSSEADASGASAPSIDPRTILFRQGLPILAEMAGRPPEKLRPILGRWLKLTGDDAGAVLAEIERCRGSPASGSVPIDPIPWIEARLKPRPQHDKPRTARDEAFAALAEWVDPSGAVPADRRPGGAGAGDDPHGGSPSGTPGVRRQLAALPGGRA